MLKLFCLICCWIWLSPFAAAEIRPFSVLSAANSEYIEYTDTFLVPPASLDLSNLEFQNVPAEFPAEHVDSQLDIVVFHEPKDASDWTTLGVGSRSGISGNRWCCNQDAVDLGICQQDNLGRLIVVKEKFKGLQQSVAIPGSDEFQIHMQDFVFEPLLQRGKYFLIFANCNDNGRNVQVSGTYIWESKHGYLPGQLFGEMFYFFVLVVAYAILSVWYGVEMRKHKETCIAIQKWIFITIVLGFAEASFRSLDYIVWNHRGTKIWFFWFMGVVCGTIKRALSRSLVVMVASGWGVLRNRLSCFPLILGLAIAYAALALAADVLAIVAIEDMKKMTITQEEELVAAVAGVSLALLVINVVYLVWIIVAMLRTMEQLRSTNQIHKLLRYRRLRDILLFFIVYLVIWFILTRVLPLYTFKDTQVAWVVSALMELDYLAVIAGVAILWRPSPNARDFAYEMQLPDTDEHELELQEVVPSAQVMEQDQETEPDYRPPPVEQGVSA